jgi:hypothetical protein
MQALEIVRAEFEAAAYVQYLLRRVSDQVTDDSDRVHTPDELFWKTATGAYGVVYFNAAWWGWLSAATAQIIKDKS